MCLLSEDGEFEGSVDLDPSQNFKEREFVVRLYLTCNFDAMVLAVQSIKQGYVNNDQDDGKGIINESAPYFGG